MLQHLNFEKVDFVIEAGQYSIRGGILDVYSFADEHPFRLEFFDTEIESIRTFDINTQLSKNIESKISILPNTEAKKSISSLRLMFWQPPLIATFQYKIVIQR